MQINYPKKLLIEETDKIKSYEIKQFILSCIEDFPEYFWTAPASGTGIYHEEEENKPGGLVTHVRRLNRLIEDMTELHSLNIVERDILLAASILHDSWCKGWYENSTNKNTDMFHPLYVPQKFPFRGFADKYISESLYDEIILCVVSHSGKYSVTKALNVDKKLPRIFQTVDYLGSRTHIKIKI